MWSRGIDSQPGAHRDPAAFPQPGRFDVRRPDARQNLAFARGQHFCVGAQLAWLQTEAAITAVLAGLPGLRLDPGQACHSCGIHLTFGAARTSGGLCVRAQA
jgi:cytochrome P450